LLFFASGGQNPFYKKGFGFPKIFYKGKITNYNHKITIYNQKFLQGVQGGGFFKKSPPGRRRQKLKKNQKTG
jgi:hypothetical protein